MMVEVMPALALAAAVEMKKKMIGVVVTMTGVMEVNIMVVMVEFAFQLGEEQHRQVTLRCPSPQMGQFRGDNQSLPLFSFEAGVEPSAAFAFASTNLPQ